MAWHELKAGSKGEQGKEGASASAVFKRAGSLSRCDARSIWARVSDFGGYSGAPPAPTLDRAPPVQCIPVAVELKPGASAQQRKEVAGYVQCQPVYDTGPNGDRFWTGWAQVDDLPTLSALSGLQGWRIGLENIPAKAGANAAAARLTRVNDESTHALIAPPVIGIIDHGIAVAHAAFRSTRDPKKTRVLALWDQDPGRLASSNPHGDWTAVPGMRYGGELTHTALQRLIDRVGREDLIYERLQYEPVQARFSHGTHVLDLAAGYPNPLAVDPAASAFEAASNAPILAVQLPYKPAKDSSGSALCVHILDALHYIERRAPKNRRIVINLSDGAYGGAHDGQSMLERAIDDFLRVRPHVTLVLAAGNAHESAGHARAAKLARDRSASFDWRVLPDDYTDSFLEVWFDRPCAKGTVALTLAPPDGLAAAVVEMGQTQTLLDGNGGVVGAVISQESGPDSAGRSMFLVAIAPTRPADRRKPRAPHGVWSVRVTNKSAVPVGVDAWIERDNPVVNESGPRRQSYFVDRLCSPRVVDGQGTLGNLAGSGEAIVVGGRYRRGRIFGGCDPAAMSAVARYSSRGPGRAGAVPGPDLVAPSDDSPVQHGLLAAANRSGAKFRLDGTSVAAPLVARRIANLLGSSANPPANRAAIMTAMIGVPQPDPDSTGIRGTIEPGREPTHGGKP